jgi:hypothetical protein
MKKLAVMLLFGGFLGLVSCTESPLPQHEISDLEISTRSCDPDQAYQDGLKSFLAAHYQEQESNVTVSYSGVNGQGEYEFPFTVVTSGNDITGDYIVEDLCADYDAEFIVEEDLVGI